MTHTVIFLPGIMGSELWLGAERIWPGSAESLFGKFHRMDDLARADLVVGDVIRSYVANMSEGRQYAAILDDLNTLGFQERGIRPTLLICPYDWRGSNRASAGELAAAVESAVDTAADVEISIVAHSMGGLVARHYLESGLYREHKGFNAVRRLITLGTPHRGAPEALLGILGKKRKVFLAPEQVAALARSPMFPGVYELLPPPGVPFLWDESAEADYLPHDFYADGELHRTWGLNAENVEAAREFWATLSFARRPEHVRYFQFAGSKHETPCAIWMMPFGASMREREHAVVNGGDGTVPLWSAFDASQQCTFVGRPHGTIYKDDSLRRILAKLLGRPGVLAAEEQAFDISVTEGVVECEETLPVTVHARGRPLASDLTLRVFQTAGEDGGSVGREPAGSPIPIRYQGAALDSITVLLTAPDEPGMYAVEIWAAQGQRALASDGLLVVG